MAEGNDEEKTEEPSSKKLADAAKKGQIPNSREVSNLFIFIALILMLAWFAPYSMKWATTSLSRFIHSPHDISVDFNNVHKVTSETLIDVGLIMLLPIMATVIAALLSSFMQNGINISGEPLIPKLEKISILKGIKRLFSVRSLVEFVKGLIKISLVGFMAYIVVAPEASRFEQMITFSVIDMMRLLDELALKMVIGATAVLFVIAMIDVIYQRFEYMKSLRMTRQELKDEFKQAEGNPEVKAKLRQIRMERAQRRMMAAVPDADVVIRNPTHYAVALKYDQAEMKAPHVTALGQELIALRIIEVAEENDIPVITNKPLARALFESATIDEEIPFEHYQAVAEIISYIFTLKGEKATSS